MESIIEVIPHRVKQEFSILFPHSPALGRKRIRPIPKPNSEKIAKIPNDEIAAVVSPTASTEKILVATTKKRKPKKLFNAAPAIIKYAFLNNGIARCLVAFV